MKIAALDLGTNTFLCLLAEGTLDQQSQKPNIQIIKDLSETVRLGQDIHTSGRIHPDALIRAEQCFEKFHQEISKHKPDRIFAVATSAARDASNGQALFDLGKKYHIPISIVDGPTEAKTTFLGATVGQDWQGNTLVIDVGGGSTELILGKSTGEILYSTSVNIGAVRLTERFVEDQPISLENQRSLCRFAETILQPHVDKILKHEVHQIIGVAGTPTSLAAIEVGGYSVEKVDGYCLSRERLAHWQKEFAETSIRIKKEKYQLGARSDIIYAGVSILKIALELLKKKELIVSTKGVRFGVAIQLLQGAFS